jgi:hypothetical protein
MSSRILLRTLLLAACVLFATAPAYAGCRAGDAAVRGSQVGFERAQAAAVTLSQNQTAAQSLLQKCVQGIANMNSGNMFPSFADMFDQVVQKVCTAATQKVNSAVGQINPANDFDKIMSGINSQVSQSTGGLISQTVTSQPVPTLNQAPTSTQTPSPDFWSNIWK